MKNKILILVAILTCFIGAKSFAQENNQSLSIRLSAGYSIFTPGSDPLIVSRASIVLPTGGNVNYNSNGKSGDGAYLGVGLQKPVGSVLILGIDGAYFAGKKLESNGTFGAGYTIQGPYTESGTSSLLSLTPSLSFRVFTQSKYYIYTRVGAILAFGTKFHSDETDTDDDVIFQNRTREYIDTYHYGLNTGLQGAAGIQFHLVSRLSGFAEIENNFLNIYPRSFDDHYIFKTAGGTVTSSGNDHFVYNKASSGNETTTNNGTGNTYTVAETIQHFNSTVLKIGVAFAIK
jgi:hypothetical protein